MPPMTSGPLAGFYAPDYDGGCITNLLASIVRHLGGSSPHADLACVPPRTWANAEKIVYLVVDGLGAEQLARHLARGGGRHFFATRAFEKITTVCPATTAAAVTTLSTGASPAEHGILGWHLHLPDLGLVSTILPATTRTGVPLATKDFDLRAYLKLPSYVDSVPGRRALLSYRHIPTSRYSRAGSRWTTVRSFATLWGLERSVAAFARGRGPGLAYAYWPGYDSACHEFGCDHPKTVAHLEKIDRSLGRLVRRLCGTGALLCVLADHGLVDAPHDQRVDLAEVPGFYDCLAVLPSGDARQVCCFVRPAKVSMFLNLVNEHLGKACVCVPGETLLEMRLLGPGREHPALRGRVGDYMLLAREGYALASTLPGSEKDFNEANHGGLSEAEVRVPLYVIRDGSTA